MTEHRTDTSYNAGLRTHRVECSACGTLRGVHTTRADADAAAAAHRRDVAHEREIRELNPHTYQVCQSWRIVNSRLRRSRGEDA